MDKQFKSMALFGGLIACCVLCTVAEEPSRKYPAQAQKRMGGMFDSLFGGGGGGGSPEPDVPGVPSGFGMYPLWKFHKFDGFSLRPVPVQLDVGHGIPTPPSSVMPSYGGPPPPYTPPQAPYTPPQAPYTPPPTYSPPAAPYSPPPQNYPPPVEYNYNKPPLTMGYQHTGQNYDYVPPSYSPTYSQSYQPASPAYNPPAASYSPSYGASQPTYNQQSNDYASQGYSGPDLGYAASNSHKTIAGNGFGSQKVPSYAAFEGNNPFGGVSVDISMPIDSNKGGYVKRYFNTESDNTNPSQQPTSEDGPEKSSKQ